MRKIVSIILFCCCLWGNAIAQLYTYFDSVYYDSPTSVYVIHDIISLNQDEYTVAGVYFPGNSQKLMITTFNTDGSNVSIELPQMPAGSVPAWFGPEYIHTSDGGYLWSGITSSLRGDVVKFSNLNDTLWTYRAAIADTVVKIYHTMEVADGYVVCGTLATPQNDDPPWILHPTVMMILKLDLNGHLL